MIGIGLPELAIILLVVGIPVWGIIDAAVRPDPVWEASGQSKLVWIFVQIVLWMFGSVAYFVFVRPRLKDIEHVPI